QAREEPGAAGIRYQPDPGEGLQEAGRLTRDDNVAGQCDAHPGACRHAIDRGDDGLGHGPHADDCRVVEGAQQLPGSELALGRARGVEVGASAKATARAGDEHGPDGIVAAGARNRFAVGGDQLGADGVEHVEPIQGDACNPVDGFVENRAGHDWSPFWSVVPATPDSRASSRTSTWSGATCWPGRAQISSTLARKGASVRWFIFIASMLNKASPRSMTSP